jgi:hypothetical protein
MQINALRAEPLIPTHPTTSLVTSGTVHMHRWRIAEQAGAESQGSCDCGASKGFVNGWEPSSTGLWRRPPATSHAS